MRLLPCVFVFAGLLRSWTTAAADEVRERHCRCSIVSFWGLPVFDDDDERPGHRSRSISEGLARGTLRPFLELTGKQSHAGEATLGLQGLRFGLSEAGERQFALAYYRSGETTFDKNTKYQLAYGGLVFGGMPSGDSITEFYFQFLLGPGQVKVITPLDTQSSRLLFVMEPEIGLGINITPWLQLGLGVSYRYLNGLQVLGLSSEELRGATANAHLLLHF